METISPARVIAQMLNGQVLTQALYVAARLDIAGLVSDGPKTAEELAGPTGTHAPSLYRLLRALAGLGVFREDEQHRFHLTPLAECLKKDAEDSQWAFAMMIGDEPSRAGATCCTACKPAATLRKDFWRTPVRIPGQASPRRHASSTLP